MLLASDFLGFQLLEDSQLCDGLKFVLRPLGPHMIDACIIHCIPRCSTETELDIRQFYLLVCIEVIGNNLENNEKLIGR